MVLSLLYYAFFLIAAIPFIYYLIAIYSAWHFFRVSAKHNSRLSFTPPVSILKPLAGLDVQDGWRQLNSGAVKASPPGGPTVRP